MGKLFSTFCRLLFAGLLGGGGLVTVKRGFFETNKGRSMSFLAMGFLCVLVGQSIFPREAVAKIIFKFIKK